MKRTLSIALALALVLSLAFIPKRAYADGDLTASAKDGQETFYLEPGDSIDLEVEASGSGSISYKWYQVGEDGSLSSLTNLAHLLRPYIYSVNNVTQSNLHYLCQASTGSLLAGNLQTATVDFIILIDNGFSALPKNSKTAFTVSPGDPVDMEVTASCRDGEVSYQWYETNGKKDDGLEKTPIEGAVSQAYSIEQAEKSAYYLCVARDIYNNKEEIPFRVTVENKLTLTADGNRFPQSFPGEELTFKVKAGSLDGVYSLQWYGPVWDDDFGTFFEGQLEGETSDQITIVVGSNSAYTCVATDSYGNTCQLTFAPRIDESRIARAAFSEDIYADPGAPADLVVVSDVADPENLTYAWTRDWDPIPDITGPELSILSVNEAAYYACEVEYKGFNLRVEFRVHVDSGFIPTIEKDVIFANTGDDVTITVDPGSYEGEVSYSWTASSGPLACTENSLTLPGVTANDAMMYECTASDEYGNMYRFSVRLDVDCEFALERAGEKDVVVPYGESATIAVKPLAIPGVSYRWEDSNGDIMGADGPELTIPSVENYDIYRCSAETEFGSTSLEFRVFVENGFYADEGYVEKVVKLGSTEPLQLTMNARSDSGVEFSWDSFGTNYSLDLSQETGSSITINEIEGNYYIQSTATDKYGNKAMQDWFITIDNGLKLDPIADVYIQSGEKAEFTVSASCDNGGIKKDIRCDYGTVLPIVSIDGDKYTTGRITNDVAVTVEVTDEYGNFAERSFSIHVSPEEGLQKGDVNGDNTVDSNDLTALSRYVAQIETDWDEARLAAADVNSDNTVDSNDLTMLSRFVAQIINSFE